MIKTFAAAIFLTISLFASVSAAQEEDIMIVERLHNLRLKQQDEEGAIRIQKFVQTNQQRQCSVEQQVRQRLRDIRDAGSGSGMSAENVVINAGHDSLNIADNHGTINSDVNVQIIEQGGEEIPCP